ncbi:hypothetical protein LX32DRAFT_647221 [Colletotrichum zoysiae]|uniref:Uncharacterized protein n=1 Tax=Colletotrichum zoysiae TaxID=1216348 RepID=A0AAD9H1H4_9PEZI|nr:hypothetical protein LX32DRAFT_647221 [Colletotrichum zoysiae]
MSTNSRSTTHKPICRQVKVVGKAKLGSFLCRPSSFSKPPFSALPLPLSNQQASAERYDQHPGWLASPPASCRAGLLSVVVGTLPVALSGPFGPPRRTDLNRQLQTSPILGDGYLAKVKPSPFS